MSVNTALPTLQRDVAEIYAARDHAALVALYVQHIGEFDPGEYGGPDDLRDEDDLRQHLIDYMREYVGVGPTKAETIANAERRIAGLNPGSLQRAREGVLLRQWGL